MRRRGQSGILPDPDSGRHRRREPTACGHALRVCTYTALTVFGVVLLCLTAAYIFIFRTPVGKRILASQMFHSISFGDVEHDRTQYWFISGSFPDEFSTVNVHFRSAQLDTVVWAPIVRAKVKDFLWLPFTRRVTVEKFEIPYLFVREPPPPVGHERKHGLHAFGPTGDTGDEPLRRQADVPWPSFGAEVTFEHVLLERVRLVNASTIAELSARLVRHTPSAAPDMSFLAQTSGTDYSVWGSAVVPRNNGNWNFRMDINHIDGAPYINVVDGFLDVSGTASSRTVDIKATLNGAPDAACEARVTAHIRGNIQSVAALTTGGAELKNGPVQVLALDVALPSVAACRGVMPHAAQLLGQGAFRATASGLVDEHRQAHLHTFRATAGGVVSSLRLNGTLGSLLQPQTWPRNLAVRMETSRPGGSILGHCSRLGADSATLTLELDDPLTQSFAFARASFAQTRAGRYTDRAIRIDVTRASVMGHSVDGRSLHVDIESAGCLRTQSPLRCPWDVAARVRGYGTASAQLVPADVRLAKSFGVELVVDDLDRHLNGFMHVALSSIHVEGTMDLVRVSVRNLTLTAHARGHTDPDRHIGRVRSSLVELRVEPRAQRWSLSADTVGAMCGHVRVDGARSMWELVSDRGHTEALRTNGATLIPALAWGETPGDNHDIQRLRYYTQTHTVDTHVRLQADGFRVAVDGAACSLASSVCAEMDVRVDLPTATLWHVAQLAVLHSGPVAVARLPFVVHHSGGVAVVHGRHGGDTSNGWSVHAWAEGTTVTAAEQWRFEDTAVHVHWDSVEFYRLNFTLAGASGDTETRLESDGSVVLADSCVRWAHEARLHSPGIAPARTTLGVELPLAWIEQ